MNTPHMTCHVSAKAQVLLLLVLILAMGWSQHARANKGATFTIQATKRVISRHEPLELRVTIGLYKSWYSGLRLPRHRHFRLKRRTQKKVKETVFVGGQVKVRTIWTLTLRYMPRKTGFFTLSPGKLRVGRKWLRTPSITIEVRKQGSSSPQTKDALPAFLQPKGDIFLLSVLEPKQVFVGQQATVTYYLFRRSDHTIDQPRMPQMPDFWSDALIPLHPLGNWKVKYLRGKQYYYTLVLKQAIFPMREGRLRVSGISFRVKKSFAGGSGKRIESPPRWLTAQPLPTANRPKQFQADAVGRYRLRIRASHREVQQGEPVTLTLEVQGTGNIKQLTLPSLPTIGGLRLTNRQNSANRTEDKREVKGTKRIRLTYLAKRAGTIAIPSLSWSTFDPWQQQYKTQTTRPLSIKVKAATAVVGATIRLKARATGGTGGSSLPGFSMPSFDSPYLWLALLPFPLFLLIWFARTFLVGRRQPMEETPTLDEENRAHTQEQLQSWLRQNQHPQPASLRELESLLHDLLKARLGMSTRSMSRAELLRTLERKGLTRETTAVIADLLVLCETARFSPFGVATQEIPPKVQHVLHAIPAV